MRLSFRSPAAAEIVIFDEAGAEVLERTVLGDIDHAVLPSRREVLFVSPHVMWQWVLCIGRYAGRDLIDPTRMLGTLYRAHLLACLRVMHPTVVVTFIDNSYPFQWASRRMPGVSFIAVQNGARCVHDVTDWLPPRPDPGSVISMPLLVCFGEWERDLYRAHGHDVDEFLPVGSIQGSYFAERYREEAEPAYDVCLVSQWDPSVMLEGAFPAMRRGVDELTGRLKEYLADRSLKLAVALRSRLPEEAAYFRQEFGESAQIVAADRPAMATYRAMASSRVSVSFCSTAGVEAFGWGARALFCNLSGDPGFDFPREGPWRITDGEADEFASRLDELLAMEDAAYRQASAEAAHYVMAYDPLRPAHVVVRERVLSGAGCDIG